MRSVIASDIAAPPELVFRLVEDVRRWPALLPHYRRVRILGHASDGAVLAEYVAVRPAAAAFGVGVPVIWRSLSWSDRDALRLHFRHVGGATAGMIVVWRIEPTRFGSRVAIEHDFERPFPPPCPRVAAGLFPTLLDRAVIRPIATRTLATVRQLAEVLASVQLDRVPAGVELTERASSARTGPA